MSVCLLYVSAEKKQDCDKNQALDVDLFYLNESSPAIDGALPPFSRCDLEMI